MTKQTIVGYYLSNENKTAFSVNEQNELIICGKRESFPPHPERWQFVPVMYDELFNWVIFKKARVCLDKEAFNNYSRQFYKMCVAMISNNAAELEQMNDEQFITFRFDFSELTTDYQLN